ncbi:MAG: hypothetical protein ACYTF1_08980 [Planctomycetota bacterium]|jgi:hypothetical protein
MEKWKQKFARKMDDLQERSLANFDRFADEALVPVFNDISEFVTQWDFESSIPHSKAGQRSFKFAVTEDCYVLILFRIEGVNTIRCEYECCFSGKGCIAGPQNSTGVHSASRFWVESCFQKAIDDFVEKFGGGEVGQEKPAMAEA